MHATSTRFSLASVSQSAVRGLPSTLVRTSGSEPFAYWERLHWLLYLLRAELTVNPHFRTSGQPHIELQASYIEVQGSCRV